MIRKILYSGTQVTNPFLFNLYNQSSSEDMSTDVHSHQNGDTDLDKSAL